MRFPSILRAFALLFIYFFAASAIARTPTVGLAAFGIPFNSVIVEDLIKTRADSRMSFASELGISVYRRPGGEASDPFASLSLAPEEITSKFPLTKGELGSFHEDPYPVIILAPNADPTCLLHEVFHYAFAMESDFDFEKSTARYLEKENQYYELDGVEKYDRLIDASEIGRQLVWRGPLVEAAIEMLLLEKISKGEILASEFYMNNANRYASYNLKEAADFLWSLISRVSVEILETENAHDQRNMNRLSQSKLELYVLYDQVQNVRTDLSKKRTGPPGG